MPIRPQRFIDDWYSHNAAKYESVMRKDKDRPLARRRLINLLAIDPGQRVLEIGGGTGTNAPLYPAHAQVTLSDNNNAMLWEARRKLREQELFHVQTDDQNAKNLSYEDDSFDVAVATYALSAIPGNRKALKEMERVIRPGGRIGIIDFTRTGRTPLVYVLNSGVAPLDLPNLIRRASRSQISVSETIPGEDSSMGEQRLYVLRVT